LEAQQPLHRRRLRFVLLRAYVTIARYLTKAIHENML
jgi:hypothetical protein